MPKHSESNEHEGKQELKETVVLTDCGLILLVCKFYKTIETFETIAKFL